MIVPFCTRYRYPFIESWDNITFENYEETIAPPTYEPNGPSEKCKELNLTRNERWKKLPNGEKAAFLYLHYYLTNQNDNNWHNLYKIIFCLFFAYINSKTDIIPICWKRLYKTRIEVYNDLTIDFMERFINKKSRALWPEYSWWTLMKPFCYRVYSWSNDHLVFMPEDYMIDYMMDISRKKYR